MFFFFKFSPFLNFSPQAQSVLFARLWLYTGDLNAQKTTYNAFKMRGDLNARGHQPNTF